MSVKANVLERYSDGAKERQESLCCPVDYDRELLKILPQEIIEKDYGCGDPSRYVKSGDVVLDLGSGGGKICYMAAQLVGDQGHVIGIDMNDDMLGLARSYQPEMADKLGGDKVDFRKGHIQDLSLSMDAAADYLAQNPVTDVDSMDRFELWKQQQRQQSPMVASDSVDLVVSNCVLNLVAEQDRVQMISEIFRTLKPGGRVAISDIVADEAVPEHLKQDPELWSGCISGAFQEKAFLQAFEDAGFVGVAYDKWESEPWQVVESIEFRSVTIVATKPSSAAVIDGGKAVMYLGPFAQVTTEDGRFFKRGERVAVSNRGYENLTSGTLKNHFLGFEPAEQVADPACFCKPAGTLRPISELKGARNQLDSDKNSGGCC